MFNNLTFQHFNIPSTIRITFDVNLDFNIQHWRLWPSNSLSKRTNLPELLPFEKKQFDRKNPLPAFVPCSRKGKRCEHSFQPYWRQQVNHRPGFSPHSTPLFPGFVSALPSCRGKPGGHPPSCKSTERKPRRNNKCWRKFQFVAPMNVSSNEMTRIFKTL